MAKAINHPGAHKYMRVSLGNKDIFKCQLPGCTHFLTHPELAIGRESLCWQCGESFIIARNEKSFYAKKLKCGECRPVELEKKFDEVPLDEMLEQLGISKGEKE